MSLTNRFYHEGEDKENINVQNVQVMYPHKKKIEKKSVGKRMMSNKTVQAIKKLTLDLKQKMQQPSPTLHFLKQSTAILTLQSGQKTQNFPCYLDQQAFSNPNSNYDNNKIQQQYKSLLKCHRRDHDVDSDQQQLALSVQYLQQSLYDAASSTCKPQH